MKNSGSTVYPCESKSLLHIAIVSGQVRWLTTSATVSVWSPTIRRRSRVSISGPMSKALANFRLAATSSRQWSTMSDSSAKV